MAFTIEELARLLGLKPRTIHFWKQTGLFEGPGAGPGARYDEEHLGTLFLIDQLRSEGTPLAEIRKEITKQSATDLRRLAEQVKATPKPPSPSAKELIATWLSKPGGGTRPLSASAGSPHSLRAARHVAAPSAPSPERAPDSGSPESGASRRAWERVPLADGIELHVRQPSTSAARKLVRELLACAQRVKE